MKKVGFSLLVVLMITGFAAIAVAQGTSTPPPPPCCGEEGVTPIRIPGQPASGATAAGLHFETSDDALRALGMTRLDFVDRVTALFFQDRAVEFLVPVTRQADPRYFAVPGTRNVTDRRSVYPTSLVAVDIRELHLISRLQLDSETAAGLRELILTDGVVQLTVHFRASAMAGFSR